MEQKSNTLYRAYDNLYKKVRLVAGAIGAAGPIIRQTRKCVLYYVRFRAQLYYYISVNH